MERHGWERGRWGVGRDREAGRQQLGWAQKEAISSSAAVRCASSRGGRAEGGPSQRVRNNLGEGRIGPLPH